MSTKYKALTTEEAYFITITVVDWIDIFTRLSQKKVIIDSLKYCQQNKGLEIYAYVIMSQKHGDDEQSNRWIYPF